MGAAIAMMEVLAGPVALAIVAQGRLPDHVQGFGLGHAGHDGHARFDNPRLFAGDQRQRIAQLPHVIEADAGDNGNFGSADIGRIQAAAQPDFQDGHVHLVAGKVQQRGGRGDLEVGWPRFSLSAHFILAIQRIHDGANPADQVDELIGPATPPVDLHPLFDAIHVRRGIQSRAIAGRGQHGRDHRGGRSLALRPRDVDDRKTLVRIAQPGSQFPHPVQAQPARTRREPVGSLVVDPPEQVGECGVVIHDVRGTGHVVSSCRIHGRTFRRDQNALSSQQPGAAARATRYLHRTVDGSGSLPKSATIATWLSLTSIRTEDAPSGASPVNVNATPAATVRRTLDADSTSTGWFAR